MCAADGVPGDAGYGSAGHSGTEFGGTEFGGTAFGSAAEALRAGVALADYLNSPAAAGLDPAALGGVLVSIGEIQSRLAAAQAGFLRRFDGAGAHDADGYGSSSAWLAAMTRLTKKDAKAAVRHMRVLGERPLFARGVARGDLSDSWAREVACWLKRLPEELRDGTEEILAEAAAAGASLEDLATITAHALAQWQADHPDEDDDDFPDRYLKIGTTFGGAGVIRGDLTPECAAAVTAVLQALGKKAGPEDRRSEPQRFHDALQQACQMLIGAKMVPDRAGTDTQVVAHISLRSLREMPGATGLEDAWIRAVLGEDGYLTGPDADAAACDALIIPVVTGRTQLAALDKMITIILAAFGYPAPPATGTEPGTGIEPGTGPEPGTGIEPGTGTVQGVGRSGHDGSPGNYGQSGARGVSPQAWQALRYAVARLAIDFVSGPAGAAAVLRRGLLEHPWNTPSLPLDIGWSDRIPAAIRRAVLLRDRHRCAWPRCGRPAAWCDVHHIIHKKDGGKTSVDSCVTLCQFHHDVCIHRWGWQIILHPDGTTTVYGPHGQVEHSHSPPASRAA
jgi:hypothetical protein